MSDEGVQALAAWASAPVEAAPDESTVRLAASAALELGAGAGSPPAYSSVKGSQRDAVLQQDAAVKRLARARLKTDPDYPALLEAFRNSPMTGLTTIVDLARRKSGYNPLASQEDANKLIRFLVELMSCPLLGPSSSGSSFEFDPAKPSGNPEAVIETFIGKDPVAGPPLRRMLEAVLGRAAANMGATQSEDLVIEYRFDADTAVGYRFSLRGASVTVVVVDLGMMHFITQAKGFQTTYAFTFDAARWPDYAQETLDRHLASLEDWVLDNTNLR